MAGGGLGSVGHLARCGGVEALGRSGIGRSCRRVGLITGEVGSRRVHRVVAGHDMRLAAVHVDLLGLVTLVAAGHIDGATIDDELRLGMERVVARLYRERSARHDALEVGVQRVIGGRDVQLAARDAQVRLRLNAVVASLDSERAPVDGHEALGRLGILVRLDAVAAGGQREVTVRDLHAVAPAQGVLHRIHHIGAARDDEVVLRAHRMTVGARHRQGARTVQREVGPAEQGGVGLVGAVFQHVVRPVRERVRRAVRQRDEALVRLPHIERRPVLVVDARAVEHHLNLVSIGNLHHQPSVIKRARHHVGALRRDGHRRPLDRSPVPIDRSRRPAQHDMRGRSVVIGSILVPVGILQVERRHIERSRHLLKRSRLGRSGSGRGSSNVRPISFGNRRTRTPPKRPGE